MLESDIQILAALTGPRWQLIEALQQGNDLSIRELAAIIGMTPTRVSHHVNALLKHGLIEQVSTRKTGGRTQRTFMAVARDFEISRNRSSVDTLRKVARINLQAAIRQLDRDRETRMVRASARLSEEDSVLVNALLAEVDSIFKSNSSSPRGKRVTLTYVVLESGET